MKTIIVRVELKLKHNVAYAIAEEVVNELDYKFEHELIEDTEIIDFS